MSSELFILKPEKLAERAKAELTQQALVLRLVAETLTKPGLSSAELTQLIEEEMPVLRTQLAVARNLMAEAEKQREALQPALDLFTQRMEGREA